MFPIRLYLSSRAETVFLPGLPGCVWPLASFMGQADTLCILSASGMNGQRKKKNHLKTRKSTSWHSHKRKGHCIISLNIV